MKMTSITIRSLLLGLLLLAVIAGTAAAQDTQPTEVTDDDVNAVAATLYCPTCENLSLDVCPTQSCAQWRDIIRLKLSEGWTQTQIENYFVAQYGDRVLPVPPRTGLNWLIYILPPLFILGAAVILFRSLNSMRAKQTAAFTAREVQSTVIDNPDLQRDNPDLKRDDPYIRRLEEDLKRRTD